MGSNNYDTVILEEVRDQYSRILEGLESLKEMPMNVAVLKDDMATVKQDIHLIKKALSAQAADTQHIKRHLRFAGE